jgi:hypothetical protein
MSAICKWIRADWRRNSVILSVVGVAALLAATRVAAATGHRWPLLLSAGLLLLALAADHRSRRPTQAGPPKWSLFGLIVGLLFAAVAAVAWWVGTTADGYRLAAAVLAVLALGRLLTEWRRSSALAPWRGPALLALCAVLFFGGLIAVRTEPSVPAIVAVVAGLLTTPVGLSLLTEDLLDHVAVDPNGTAAWPRLLWWPGLLGLVLAGSAYCALLRGATETPRAAAAIALTVAAVLVFAISVNAQADIAVLVLLLLVVGSVLPQPVDFSSRYAHDPGERVVVALGDSYMSGEGAQRYFRGTNDKGSNECRRAPTAYAPLLIHDGDLPDVRGLVFLACSGARAAELYDVAQGTHPGSPRVVADGADTRKLTQLAHLARLRAVGELDVEVLLLSIGGNDSGFSTIGLACVAPGDCTELREQWLAGLAVVRQKLDTAYWEVARAVDGRFPVAVVPYPIPLTDTGCDATWLTKKEHQFLFEFTRRLNDVIEATARDYGFGYVESMEQALGGRADGPMLRLCDDPDLDKVGVNFVGLRSLKSVNGPIEQRVNPQNFMHNTFHPNEAGHDAMRRTMLAWLVAHKDLPPPARVKAGSRPPAPTDSTRPCEVAEIDDDGACETDARDWAVRKTVDFVSGLAPLSLATLVGIWLMCLTVIRAWRSRGPAPLQNAPTPD